jgi:hypothetical protein
MTIRTHHCAMLALAFSALATGCTQNRYCSRPQDYETAPSVAPLKSVEDMKVEPGPGAYLIPPASPSPVPFGQKVADPKKSGKTHWSCLDQPPTLPPPTASSQTPAAKP